MSSQYRAHGEAGGISVCQRRGPRCADEGGAGSVIGANDGNDRRNPRGGFFAHKGLAVQVLGPGAVQQTPTRLADQVLFGFPDRRRQFSSILPRKGGDGATGRLGPPVSAMTSADRLATSHSLIGGTSKWRTPEVASAAPSRESWNAASNFGLCCAATVCVLAAVRMRHRRHAHGVIA
jgi:hypothetical protein